MKITAGETNAYTVIKQARTPAYSAISRGRDARIHSNNEETAGGDAHIHSNNKTTAGETPASPV